MFCPEFVFVVKVVALCGRDDVDVFLVDEDVDLLVREGRNNDQHYDRAERAHVSLHNGPRLVNFHGEAFTELVDSEYLVSNPIREPPTQSAPVGPIVLLVHDNCFSYKIKLTS